MARGNYRLSVNGYSTFFDTKEEALAAGKAAHEEDDFNIVKVFREQFNQLIAEF